MKILRLKTENVQRVKIVEISPDGNVIVVGGNNGQGKTSLLDSILFGLGGKRALSALPVRKGEKNGNIEIETEDFVAQTRITPDRKTEIEVTRTPNSSLPDGSPQKLLDGLVSQLTFDPLAFAGMKEKDQVAVLESLVPFNFHHNRALRESTYNERTFTNKNLKQKQAENEANPFDPTLPVDEVPLDAMLRKMTSLADARAEKSQLEQNIQRGKDKLNEIALQTQKLAEEHSKITVWLQENEPKIQQYGDLSSDCLAGDLKVAEDKNRLIKKNSEARRIYAEAKQLETKANELTNQIEKLDREKIAAIEAASLPVAGLSFSDDAGVQFGGIPFSQLSGAERLKVSLAIGIALNPTLRILLIRDGSLLDGENLEIVKQMAEAHDMQVWLERVGKGEECSVIIEDGMVSEDRTHVDKER